MFFTKFICLPLLNTFHEKKMSIPSPLPTYTFFHLDFFVELVEEGGTNTFWTKNLKVDLMILKLSIPLKKTF